MDGEAGGGAAQTFTQQKQPSAASTAVQQVKRVRVTPAFHVRVPAESWLLRFQPSFLPVSQRARHTWASATHVGGPDGLPGAAFSLDKIRPSQVNERMEGRASSLCVTLSKNNKINLAGKEVNKKT